MATRAEVLAELGIAPQWRLRECPFQPDGVMWADRAAATRRSTVAETVSRGSPRSTWDRFAADVDACTACALCKTRKRSVPGVGRRPCRTGCWSARRPAPRRTHAASRSSGQAGRLLDNMLAALGLARGDNVYIANVLKCRPPNNRTPEPLEVAACRPYLDRQIALIEPKLILALGKSAATTLLDVDATIASLRGRVHRYQGVPLVVTYHPAYLLRNLADKAKAWEDLLLARRTLAG